MAEPIACSNLPAPISIFSPPFSVLRRPPSEITSRRQTHEPAPKKFPQGQPLSHPVPIMSGAMQPRPEPERRLTRYYAHTAEDAAGNRLPESSGQWQPLADHLRNVAEY